MKNKTIGYWWVATIAVMVLAVVFDDGTPEGSAELYTLAGLGMIVFGSIAAYKLSKYE